MKNNILVLNNGYRYILEGIGNIVLNVEEFFAKPETFKLVQFTGGEDVSPSLYGHTSPNEVCYTNPSRDVHEQQIFELALSYKIPMVGICRGSQLLNVLNGGVMIHHLTSHQVDHNITTAQGETFNVTSTHHQMSLITNDAVLLAWSTENRSNYYVGDKDKLIDYTGPEVESFFYPKTQCFGAQFHPEYMPKESRAYKWYRNAVKDLLLLSSENFEKKYTNSLEMSV